MDRISIILPTAGSRPDYLIEAVRSLRSQVLSHAEAELLVVENRANSQLSLSEVCLGSEGMPVRLFHEPKIGAMWARHRGYRESRGNILVFVDDDIVAPPGWLSALLRSYMDPMVGCTGGKVILDMESPPPKWWKEEFREGHLAQLDYGTERILLNWPRCVWSCNMSVRRHIFESVGGFNPDFSADPAELWNTGDNECGLEWKILQAGYKIFYEPDAWVKHRIPAGRLTPEYFYRRNFIEGVMESYTYVRALKGQSFILWRLWAQSMFCLAAGGRKWLTSFFKNKYRFKTRADGYRWWGKGLHRWHAAKSAALRDFIWRQSYLNE